MPRLRPTLVNRDPDYSLIPIPELGVPWLVRLLGGKHRDGPRAWRMTWGELSIARGAALALCLFSSDDPLSGRFSLHLHVCWVKVFVRLPSWLDRWAHHPHEMMESWGVSLLDGVVHLNWGRHYKILTLPWRNWRHISHEVLRADSTWEPYVGSYEHDKLPDQRRTEQYVYAYLCRDGSVQKVMATVHAERRIWRLRWFPFWKKTRVSMDVEFSNEVGERTGSWKGGCVGCGYDLRPGESLRACLQRMQRDRRFE